VSRRSLSQLKGYTLDGAPLLVMAVSGQRFFDCRRADLK
jgi:hypothetical protein